MSKASIHHRCLSKRWRQARRTKPRKVSMWYSQLGYEAAEVVHPRESPLHFPASAVAAQLARIRTGRSTGSTTAHCSSFSSQRSSTGLRGCPRAAPGSDEFALQPLMRQVLASGRAKAASRFAFRRATGDPRKRLVCSRALNERGVPSRISDPLLPWLPTGWTCANVTIARH
jgi:hypothetical protein